MHSISSTALLRYVSPAARACESGVRATEPVSVDASPQASGDPPRQCRKTNKRKNVLGGSEIQPSCACLQHASQNATILRCMHTQPTHLDFSRNSVLCNRLQIIVHCHCQRCFCVVTDLLTKIQISIHPKR